MRSQRPINEGLFETAKLVGPLFPIGLCRHLAFNLIELLVTMVIISIFAALILPCLSAAKVRTRQITCLSNMKEFIVAFQLYAVDHEDAVLPNQDGQRIPLGQTWVEGWLGLPGPDRTNTLLLQRSLVGPYIKASKVWCCPASSMAVTAP